MGGYKVMIKAKSRSDAVNKLKRWGVSYTTIYPDDIDGAIHECPPDKHLLV